MGLIPSYITWTGWRAVGKTAAEASAVMQLARRVPLSLTANTAIPVMMDQPEAGWVTEGGVKPVGHGGVGVKQMQDRKSVV